MERNCTVEQVTEWLDGQRSDAPVHLVILGRDGRVQQARLLTAHAQPGAVWLVAETLPGEPPMDTVAD